MRARTRYTHAHAGAFQGHPRGWIEGTTPITHRLRTHTHEHTQLSGGSAGDAEAAVTLTSIL